MADVYMRILLQAKNQYSGVFGGLMNALGNLKFGLQNLGTEGTIGMDAVSQGSMGLAGSLLKIGALAAAAGAGVALWIGDKAVHAATDYQQAITQLQNTTGSSDKDMKQYIATIRSLSDQTGVAQTNLASGMYQIISANFAGADATRILTTATRSAIIANADQTQVTTGLVVTLNAFSLKASQVDNVSNQMFKTLALGRGNISDLAGALQTGAALVAHYGVSVTDMDATLATLSTGGMKTFGTSMTGLTQLLNVMDGKTDLITKRMHKLGIPFDEAKFKAMSFQQQVQYLNHALENNKGQMVTILGSKQAATSLSILGTHATLLATNIKKLGDAHELAKEKQQAWAKTQQTFSFQMQKLGTNIQNILIDLGMQLLPILTNLVTGVSNVVSGIATWVEKNNIVQNSLAALHTAALTVSSWIQNAIGTIQNIVSWFQQWHGVILSVAGVITAFFLPALIKSGVEAGIAGAKLAASFIANMVRSGVEAVVNGAKITAQFVTSIVKAGVAGWQAAGKLALWIGNLIKSGVQATIAGAKTAASWTANIVKSGAEAVIAGAKTAASWTANIVKAGAEAAIAGAKIAAEFIANIVKAGIEAVVTAGKFVASLIPAIVSMAAEAIGAAVTAIPALVTGFGAWAVGAGAAAIATVAATWPILAIAAVIAAVVAGIVLAVQHWGQIMDWISGKAEQTRIKVEEQHVKMALAQDQKTAEGAKKAVANLEKERQGILQKLRETHDPAERAELYHQLKMITIQEEAQKKRLQKAEEDKKKQLEKQKELQAQMEEANKNWFQRLLDWIGGRLTDLKNLVGGWFSNFGTFWHDRWNDLTTTLQNIWNGFVGIIKSAINWIIDQINGFIKGIDGLGIDIGSVHIHPSIPLIPHLASGGILTSPGLVQLGEFGAETVALPAGAAVYPHGSVPAGMTAAGAGGPVINVTVNGLIARDKNELITFINRELSRQFRGSTNIVTQSSGGRSS